MRRSPEPWLRATHLDVDPVQRQALHALELCGEDCLHWRERLVHGETDARPFGLEPISFHLRHIARSLDRLLSYAEGAKLDEAQFLALRTEMESGGSPESLRAELNLALDRSARRIRAFSPTQFGEPRYVGRARLPTTVAGLLIHCAEHTQRHTGQVVTTAKLLLALRVQV